MRGVISKTESGEASPEETIRKVPIFQKLSEEQLGEILKLAVPKNFQKGEFVLREGTPSLGFYVVCEGIINVHRVEEDGTERVIRLFRARESFAEASLVPTGIYPASARAETNSRLLLIPKTPFLQLLARHPDLALCIIGSLSSRIHQLVNSVDRLRRRGVRRRLLQWIASQCPADPHITGFSIRLDRTKAALAAELGIRHETLSRAFGALRAEGLIAMEGKQIRIPDRKALRANE